MAVSEEAVAFFILLANSLCAQLSIDERGHVQTASASHDGLCRFIIMPIGSENATANYERAVKIRFVSVRRKLSLVYLANMPVF